MAGKEVVPEAHYVFDIDKLEPGDILLTRIPMNLHDASTWDSHLIQSLARSRFSAAALHLGDGLFIEAVGSGVARLPLLKAGIRDANNVRLLRVRKGDEWIGRRAAACGLRFWQRGFCCPSMPKTKCSAFQDVRRAAVAASGLIASAYENADFALFADKSPYSIFPGDLLQSPRLEDVTDSILIRLSGLAPTTFCLDDSTLCERVQHWEVATQLKILCNYEVRRILDIQGSKPSSMRELEQLIADKRWSALDETVSRSLRWYRYAKVFQLKQQQFLGESSSAAMPSITRLLPTAMQADGLARAATAIAADLRLLDGERTHWSQQRDYYAELLTRYEGKTFTYMLDLYEKQLASSEQMLQQKLQQSHLYRNEAQRRGLRMKIA